MKSAFFRLAAILFAAGAFLTVSAQEKLRSYTFPNGKTIDNPYVISVRPDGLEIGHKTGVMFVKFKDLPAEVQEKFNYDPAKAEEYEKKMAQQKADSVKRKADDAAKLKADQDKLNKRLAEYNKEKLVDEISKTQNRIDFLSSEIPKLEKQCEDMLDRTAEVASADLNSSKEGRESSDIYCDGYVIVSGGGYSNSRAENTRRKTIRDLTEEYTVTKKKLRSYKKELQDKTNELDAMKRRQEKPAN